MRIIGIDLAWGERNPDGLALIEVTFEGEAILSWTGSAMGDGALTAWLEEIAGAESALLALDGPIICENPTGARPVDREAHRRFGRAHAGCYPANLTRCPRPNRLRQRLEALGYRTDFRLQEPRQASDETGEPLRRLIEVYPHPATLALFDLDHIIRYKKGSAVDRGRELRRCQRLLGKTLSRMNPPVRIGEMVHRIFAEDPATLRGVARKRHEDTLDAIVCALVGWIHWSHGGQRSKVLGDLQSGFIVVPLADGAMGDAWTTS